MSPEFLGLVILYSVSLSILAILTGVCLHEYSHYAISRIWTDEVTVLHRFYIFPHAVEIHDNSPIPNWGIRLLAFAPQIFLLPVIGALYLVFGLPFTIFSIDLISAAVYLGILFAPVVMSPSDWIAILFPEEWRTMLESGDSFSHVENLRLLIRLISDSVEK